MGRGAGYGEDGEINIDQVGKEKQNAGGPRLLHIR